MPQRVQAAAIMAAVFLGTYAIAAPAAAQVTHDRQPFDDARKLVTDGRSEEAFTQYLAIPGGEFAAVALARGEAGKFLTIIQQDPRLPDAPRAQLAEAELLLATSRTDEAKQRFHKLATTAPKNHWGTGQPGYYPVEPPAALGGGGDDFHGFAIYQPMLPFCYGPGSHRDNWLLRRLIALDLTEDAAREFARLWEIHRANTLPYRIEVPRYDEKFQPAGKATMVVRPSGYNSHGLQFALDYAFFLKRAGRPNDALAMLMEPLRVMDMDRNPNLTRMPPPADGEAAEDYPLRNDLAYRHAPFGPGRVGVARKEFVRLTCGEFKSAGQEAMLIDDLRQRIGRGDNRARRVLAQVKAHQGRNEEALALELEYIDQGGFGEASPTYAFRRGLVFETYQKHAGAISAFEQVLVAPPGPMSLPEPEERISESPYQQSSAYQDVLGPPGSRTPAMAYGEVRDHLVRLYAAAGRTDKVLEIEFAQFDADDKRLENLETIDQMAVRFKAAGQEARFNEWAKKKMETAKSPRARANLAWQLQDYPAAMTHAAATETHGYSNIWQEWRERFAKLGRDQERAFLRAVVKANPQDAVARLNLLDLEDRLDGPDAIAALEALLATDANQAFPRGKGVWNRTHFQNYYDLAYRLMRLYEKNNALDKLRALGLRLAKGDKPFDNFDVRGNESPFENGREEFGNACLALAVKYAADPAYQVELATALKTSRWVGARAQLARMTGTAPATAGGTAPPWANLPRDVRLIVSCESVACVARNDRFVYVGLPWGLAVYDFNGTPVTRILLGASVTTLAAADNQVWAGTDEGLFCIKAESWAITHEALGKVNALGLDGDQLWIGVGGRMDNGLMVLNRNTLALRTFSAEEIGIERTMDFTRFESDGEYVWADNYFGLLRYDRAADTWSAVENPGPRDPVHLIGIIDGQVWADVWLDDALRHRPALLDRKTLRLTPLHLRGNLTRDQRMINSVLFFHGHDHGQPVFTTDGGSWGSYVVEKDSNTIRRLRQSGTENPETISDPLPNGLLLPDGRSFRIPTNAWPDGLRAGVRAMWYAERWPGDAVWAVVFDDTRRQEWLCVGAGLAVLPREGTAIRHFGRAEGLSCGAVMDGVELGGKLYFASGWDEARGCLTVYEPQTGGFTPWFRADGMDTDRVVGLAVKDGQLEVRYGVEFHGDDYNNRRPPGRFNPTTGQFTSGGTQEIPPVEGKRLAPAANGTLPVLGGPAYRSYERDGMTWHCGSRGLVIYPGRTAPALTFAALNAQRIPNPTETLRQEAKLTDIPKPVPLDRLRELVASPNKYVRANALAAAITPVLQGGGAYVPVIAGCVRDPYRNVRSTAMWLLSRSKTDAVLPALRQALEDNDPGIRAVAAIALANRGEVPPLSCFEEIIRQRDGFGNCPFGADSSIGVEADPVRAYAALAPHADRRIFEFLVSRPPPNHDDIKKLYPVLGGALKKHPDAADVLLAVQDAGRYGPLRGFVQGIFQQAGRELLPVLHEALASDDRFVRSNAARACGAIGAIGDVSSIPPLVKALDMESGLARASIVWALGELKAREAVPRLIDLYQDARNHAHNRMAGSGFMAQQSLAANREEYTALRNLDAIASDWEEMKVTTMRRPRDPRRDEELLTPDLVLEAVHKIGPAAAPEFYRALAGAGESTDRAEAAVGLAEVAPADREMSLTILRNLSGDPEMGVRIRASTSLILLDEPGADAALRERLRTGDADERGEILRQLGRLPKPRLEFFRKETAAIASNNREPEFLRNLAAGLAGK